MDVTFFEYVFYNYRMAATERDRIIVAQLAGPPAVMRADVS